MIKIVSLIRRNPALDPDAFRRYWQEVHAPLVRSRLPHLVRYTGAFPVRGAHGPVAVDAADYDLVVEMGFPDRQTMAADMTSPAFLAQDRQDSSAYFMDATSSRAIVVEEVDVL